MTHKALASAITVIAQADDSSGIIGGACRRLLDLHPRAAAAAVVPETTRCTAELPVACNRDNYRLGMLADHSPGF